MNKIFKVIYSKTRHCYVVVSELAKSHCKTTQSHTARSKTALTAAVLLALGTFSVASVFMPITAEAADKTRTDGSNFVGVERTNGLLDESKYENSGGKGANGADSITLGLRAKAGEGTITIGDRNAGASLGSVYVGQGDIAKPKIDIGGWATSIGYNSDATGYGSIALGSNAVAKNSYAKDSKGESLHYSDPYTENGEQKVRLVAKPDIQRASVAIGYGASADNGNIAIGSYSEASTDLRAATDDAAKAYLTEKTADSYVSVGKTGALRRISNVADGASASDVATVGQLQALSKEVGSYKKGFGIKIDADSTDNTKNTISLDRNLGNDYNTTDDVNLKNDADGTSLILGGRVEKGSPTGGQSVTGDYGALGRDSVTVGGVDNTVETTGNAAVVVGGIYNKAAGTTSAVVGGSANDAIGNESAVFGGQDNDAYETYATISGGSWNKAYGKASSIFGGSVNDVSGKSSVAVGGYGSHVYGDVSVGIAGGSTNADYALAAGNEATVTVNNGTAIGYQATANKEGTVAFGHDKGDVYYTSTWPQKATEKDGKYYDAQNKEITKDQYEALRNADLTFNDYSQKPKVTENKYDAAAYNRLVKVADGVDDHDVVVMEQLKNAKNDLKVNAGWGINVNDVTTKNDNGTETTTKNVISLNRNLGTNYGNPWKGEGKVTFEAGGENSMILGGAASILFNNEEDNVKAGAYGKDSVLVGGFNNLIDTVANDVTQTGENAVIVGGDTNKVTGLKSVIVGGYKNTVSGGHSIVIGGASNETDGGGAGVFGGQSNKAAGGYSSVLGGDHNEADGDWSSAIGGTTNTASGLYATTLGGKNNDAKGKESVVVGGGQNVAIGEDSTVNGGAQNTSYGMSSYVAGGMNNMAFGNASVSLGGIKSNVNAKVSTGIAGGSTEEKAITALAAGHQSVVTNSGVEWRKVTQEDVDAINQKLPSWSGFIYTEPEEPYTTYVLDKVSTAVGYQSTADAPGVIAFGHDKGDVASVAKKWKQKATMEVGDDYSAKFYDANHKEISAEDYYKLANADGTLNDYTQDPIGTENTTYQSAYYNRLVKAADGIDAHDAVVMEQLKPYTKSDASNIGANLKTYTVGDDGETITETDASNIDKTTNENAWGTALGTGKIADSTESDKNNPKANGSLQLVTGGTVYSYNKPVAVPDKTLQYVKEGKTTGENLGILDATLNDKNHNIKYYAVDETKLPKLTNFNGKDYSNEKNDGAKGMGSMAAGFNTHADGIASTVAGSYSGVVGTGLQGAAALSYGTFNVNQNAAQAGTFSGVANSIVGQANVTTDSNAAIIYGAGNTVKNSYRDIDTKNVSEITAAAGSGDVTKLGEALQKAVPTSGGQVMVMGGGNNVESAYMSQVVGVGNTVKGNQVENTKGEWGTDTSDTAIKDYNSEKSSQYNYVDGFNNEVINGKHDYIIGSNNTVSGDSTDNNQSNIVFGDNHKLTSQKNNVIIGSSDTTDDETKVSDVVAIGHNAKVSAEGGVAIGSGSEATVTGKSTEGYDPATGQNSTKTTAAWQATNAAVSIGTSDGTVTRQINGVAAGTNDTDAVNVAQLKKLEGMKANVDASNIGANLKGSDGKTAASASDITANEDAWGTAIGTGTIASTSGQLVTGKTVYGEVRPTADGTYIKTANTTAANLTALDTQVGTNTGDITNLKDLSNISNKGETVIKNLAKNTVKVKAGERVTVTDKTDSTTGAITYTVSANNNGAVAAGDTNLVSGDTVNTAITNAVNNAGTETDTKLAGKANVDASNIGANLKGSDGKTAASASDITANEDAWGTAIGTGTIASTSGQLVTGKTVYGEVRPTADGTYIKTANTTAANLTALDTQVGRNTTNISNLQNGEGFTDKGNTYIKNLAKGSIGMENGSHTTVSHRDANGVETYKVDVNVDGKVESGNKGIVDGGAVYSAIQDVKNQTSADLANKANVDASNLTPNNVTKWQEKLGNGKVESGNTGLVTGDTVFKAVDTKANRDGSNLTDKEADSFSEKIARGEVKAGENRAVSGDAVSQAISKVTGDMNTKLDGKANTSLDNITKDGQTVIKKLSQDAVQVKAGDDHITVDAKTDETTGNKTYTISAKDGKVASGDTGLISGGTLYNEVHVDKDGSYIKSGNTVGNNLSALDTGLKNTSSLIHTNTSGDTIHIGETSKATKVDVSSTDANGNKNGRVVTGVVTDAKDANSAANVGYVNGLTAANTQQIYRDMNNAYSRLDTNINRAAAGSNALAALHPLDFDPADKASFAVGYGHYRNANAAAVGAFYQPNANTMVNMGVSLGNGDPGFNAGVSFKIGKGSVYNGVSKAEMAQTIHDQATEISAIKADDAAKDKRIDALEKENQEMKKQIQEILARLNG